MRALSVNDLNELTEATRSGYLMVRGFTTLPATNVTVADNGLSGTEDDVAVPQEASALITSGIEEGIVPPHTPGQ